MAVWVSQLYLLLAFLRQVKLFHMTAWISASKENWQLQETIEDSCSFEQINQETIIVLLAVLNLRWTMNWRRGHLSFLSSFHSTSWAYWFNLKWSDIQTCLCTKRLPAALDRCSVNDFQYKNYANLMFSFAIAVVSRQLRLERATN